MTICILCVTYMNIAIELQKGTEMPEVFSVRSSHATGVLQQDMGEQKDEALHLQHLCLAA